MAVPGQNSQWHCQNSNQLQEKFHNNKCNQYSEPSFPWPTLSTLHGWEDLGVKKQCL